MKNAKSNSKILNQGNIKTVQHLIVQYYKSTPTITIAITTIAIATSAIWKSRILDSVQHQKVQYWNGATSNSATLI